MGDGAVAVAALSTLANTLGDCSTEVWVLATVGEEGLGNLAGVTAALARPSVPIQALIAVEGNYLGRVCTVGVGSVRWAVTLSGLGGHAWERSAGPSAVHAAARLIAALDELERPVESRSSLNVGRISGGEAINARARSARFDLDLRADDPAALGQMELRAKYLIDERADQMVDVSLEELGRRPAGSIDAAHPLVVAARGALQDVGLEATMISASTDANAAHAVGMPAIAIGVTVGGGEHTDEEWIDVRPLPTGLSALAGTVRRFVDATEKSRA